MTEPRRPRRPLPVSLAVIPLFAFTSCGKAEEGDSAQMSAVGDMPTHTAGPSGTESSGPPSTSPSSSASSSATGPGPTGGTGGATGPTGGSGPAGASGSGGMGAAGSSGMGGASEPSGGASGGSGGAAGAGGSSQSEAGAGGAAGTSTAGGTSDGGMGGGDPSGGGASGVNGEFTLTGPWAAGEDCIPEAKDACDDIPVENRATMIGGQNIMPTITWTPGPEGTQSYALVYQDLSNGFSHWAMWNIPVDVLSVGPDTIPEQASQAGLVGAEWFGSGACENVYQLSVHALSVATLEPGGGQAQTAVRDQLDGDDGSVVLATDFARVTPKPPCGG